MSDPIRVLIVDDSPEIRSLLKLTIRATQGLDWAGEAEDVIAGVEAARQLQPDAVILDVEMPRLNGLDAIPLIQEAAPGVRIVVFSSNDPAVDDKAVARGAYGYRRKGDDIDLVISDITDLKDESAIGR